MRINLFWNESDNRVMNKTLQAGPALDGNLTMITSVSSPIIDIQATSEVSDPPKYNYAQIPDFQRYYYVENIENIGRGMWRLHLTVDVLMSFRRDISRLYAVIDKSAQATHGDEYIDDGSLVSQNRNFVQVINFPVGFQQNPQLILITAG